MNTSEKFKKLLRRRMTVMLIPHSESRTVRLSFSMAFIVFMAVGWTGLTVWSGFIASQHVDYWRARTNESVRPGMYHLSNGSSSSTNSGLTPCTQSRRALAAKNVRSMTPSQIRPRAPNHSELIAVTVTHHSSPAPNNEKPPYTEGGLFKIRRLKL
jgi:cytoskeletal protein RodZ